MIHDRLIVCIANSWDYDPTSKHHLMKILSKTNDVLWVNYHGSRRPEANATDLKDVFSTLRRVAHGIRRISPSMAQITPMVIPGATNPLLENVHERMVITQIRRAIRHMQGDHAKPVQLWTFAPDVPYLVGALDEECSVYYCVDEYRQFEGYNVSKISRAEDELLRRADVLVASSEVLLESKSQGRPDAVLVRHGVDYEHFSSAWRGALQTPQDIASIPGPVFGYFGLIEHWVDLELLANVARLRPEYSFVVLGECKSDVSALRPVDNIHLLGRRPYEELPAYCAAFDAAMMLFAQTPMTRNVNPIKMYEYLAAGLPVISTPLPEAKRFSGSIRFAQTPEQYAKACDDILNEGEPDRERLSRIVRNETWTAKAEYLSDIVMSRVNPVLRSASMAAADVGSWSRIESTEEVALSPTAV